MFDVGRYRQGSNAAIKYFKLCLFRVILTLHESLTFVIGGIGIPKCLTAIYVVGFEKLDDMYCVFGVA